MVLVLDATAVQGGGTRCAGAMRTLMELERDCSAADRAFVPLAGCFRLWTYTFSFSGWSGGGVGFDLGENIRVGEYGAIGN